MNVANHPIQIRAWNARNVHTASNKIVNVMTVVTESILTI